MVKIDCSVIDREERSILLRKFRREGLSNESARQELQSINDIVERTSTILYAVRNNKVHKLSKEDRKEVYRMTHCNTTREFAPIPCSFLEDVNNQAYAERPHELKTLGMHITSNPNYSAQA